MPRTLSCVIPLASFFQAARSSTTGAACFSLAWWPQPAAATTSTMATRSCRMVLFPIRAQHVAVARIARPGPGGPGDARRDAADAAVAQRDHQGADVRRLHDAEITA